MEIIAGQNDTAELGTVVPISAKITDANGTIVPGQLVNWVITAGSGSLFVAASVLALWGRRKAATLSQRKPQADLTALKRRAREDFFGVLSLNG